MLDTLFSATSGLAMIGWAGLLLLPGQRFVVSILARVLIPGAIAAVYVYLMVTNLDAAPPDSGFSSIAGVKAFFTIDALLLAGWVHYLAFDLFVGSWEVSDSRREGIPHLLIIPCLISTFMAGPIGLALYFLIKYVRRAFHARPAEAL